MSKPLSDCKMVIIEKITSDYFKVSNREVDIKCENSIKDLDKTINKLHYYTEVMNDCMLICYYCGRVLHNSTVNSDCRSNRGERLPWCKFFCEN